MFVSLRSFWYQRYPQLKGAKIKSGYALNKGPGIYFYITDKSAGAVVAKGITGKSSNAYFQAGSGASHKTSQAAEIMGGVGSIIGNVLAPLTQVYVKKMELEQKEAFAKRQRFMPQQPMYQQPQQPQSNIGIILLAILGTIVAGGVLVIALKK